MKLSKRKERPLFDYLSFIQELHVRDLRCAVWQGLAYKKKRRRMTNLRIILDRVFSKFRGQVVTRVLKDDIDEDEFAGTMCQLLLDNCHRLKTLCVRMDMGHDHFVDPYRRIRAYMADSHGLSTLTEFEWRANEPSAELLKALTNATCKLTTIRIYHLPLTSWDDTRVGESLITLIGAQHKLIEFELGWTGRDCTSIMRALERHSSTLQSLHFIEVSFRSWQPLKILSDTVQLRSLKFQGCKHVTAELLDSLAYGHYPQLLSLDFYDTKVPSTIMKALLSTCGSTLELVNLGESESCGCLIKAVSMYCPKVCHFGANIESEDAPFLLKYLLEHHYMKSLVISGSVADMNWLFVSLSIKEFPNLKNLSIRGFNGLIAPYIASFPPQVLSPQTFEIFLSRCKPPIEKLNLDPCQGNGDCFTDVGL
jgi:hypothetical protein